MKLIAVQILTPEKEADEATMKRINIMRQSLNQSDLLMVEGIIQTIKETRKQRKCNKYNFRFLCLFRGTH